MYLKLGLAVTKSCQIHKNVKKGNMYKNSDQFLVIIGNEQNISIILETILTNVIRVYLSLPGFPILLYWLPRTLFDLRTKLLLIAL